MSSRARAAALLPVWAVVTAAGLASTLSFSAVLASGPGCLGTALADLVSIAGVAGLGLAVAALLMVVSVPRYRTAAGGAGALGSFALSVYTVVAFLAQDGAVCAF